MGEPVTSFMRHGAISKWAMMFKVNDLGGAASIKWSEWDEGERRYKQSPIDLADVRVSMRRRTPDAPHLVLDVAGKRKIAYTLCGEYANETMLNLAMFPVGDERGSEMWNIMCKECKRIMVAVENGDK